MRWNIPVKYVGKGWGVWHMNKLDEWEREREKVGKKQKPANEVLVDSTRKKNISVTYREDGF